MSLIYYIHLWFILQYLLVAHARLLSEDGTVFLPEELELHLRLKDQALRRLFREAHSELFTADYRWRMQARLSDGAVPCVRTNLPTTDTVSAADDCALVLHLQRRDRLRHQQIACPADVPERVVDVMNDGVFERADHQLTFTAVRGGAVGDFFREANGEADVDAEGGVADRRQT